MTKCRKYSNEEWPEWLLDAWNKSNWEEGSVYLTHGHPQLCGLSINTLEGVMQIKWDDYIIQGVLGEIYPCKPDIFEMTYSKVE